MSNIKKTLENAFVRSGYFLYQNRLKTLVVMAVLIGSLAWQITYLTIDTSSEGMLHKKDPGILEYNRFRDQFGNSSIILISISAPDIFGYEFLKKLKSFHEAMEEEVPYVREVRSLINARNTYGKGDTLYVDDLLKDWPENGADLSEIKQKALADKVYRNNIVSNDGHQTAVIIETEALIEEKTAGGDLLAGFEEDAQPGKAPKTHYLTSQETKEIVDAVEKVINRYHVPDFSIEFTGGPVVVEIYNRVTKSDMGFLLMLANIIVITILALLFRRISGVVLPFVIVESALVSTLGLMAVCKLPITLFSVVLPSFLVAVGIADSVHILAIFYRQVDMGRSKGDAIAYALGHSGLAIVLTSLTTAAGLLSFSFSELLALGELGIITAAGVMLALVYTIVLLPSLLAVIPIKPKKIITKTQKSIMDRVLTALAVFSTAYPKRIIAASLVLCVICGAGLFKLKFSHNLLKYFSDSMKVKQDVISIDREFRGSMVLEAVVDTKKENGIYDADLLNRIEQITSDIYGIKNNDLFIGKIISINDILKETNQALNRNDSSYYAIPQDENTIAQEFLLFENSGSDDLEKIVDSQFSKTRISIKIPWVDLVVINNLITDLQKRMDIAFKGKADIVITGMTALMGRTITAAIHSMAESYIIAFVVITIMMLFLVGSVKFGLASMVPNLIPIVMVMGLMGLAGMPLDMTSLMIGSIAIGLVVDDTMHFMYNFRKYYDITGSATEAVKETFLSTGRAIVITSLVLSANFFSLMTATLRNTASFGFFTGLVIVIALLADLVLAPAMMMVMTEKTKK